jgi:hypothetical protein
MTNNESGSAIRKLEVVLERERRALVTGRLDALAALIDKKEDLIAKINEPGQRETGELQSIQKHLERNRFLLDSAMAGIRAVADRMKVTRNAGSDLEIYDMNGSRLPVANRKCRKLEKRA